MRDHWWQLWRDKTDPPGSEAAAKAGCLCPVGVNNAGAFRPKNGWVVRASCPIHGSEQKNVRPLNESP